MHPPHHAWNKICVTEADSSTDGYCSHGVSFQVRRGPQCNNDSNYDRKTEQNVKQKISDQISEEEEVTTRPQA